MSVTTTPVFAFGTPVLVTKRFTNSPPTARRGYDIRPNGEFVGRIPVGQPETGGAAMSQMVFVLNWHEELKRLVPTK